MLYIVIWCEFEADRKEAACVCCVCALIYTDCKQKHTISEQTHEGRQKE